MVHTIEAFVELPRGPIHMINHPDQTEGTKVPRNEVESVFGIKLPRAIDVYSRLLGSDSPFIEKEPNWHKSQKLN